MVYQKLCNEKCPYPREMFTFIATLVLTCPLTLKLMGESSSYFLGILSWHVSLHIFWGFFFFFFGARRKKWKLTDKLMNNIYAFRTSYLKAMFKVIACYLCCEITKPSSRVNLNVLICVFQTPVKKLIFFSIIHSMIQKVWYFSIQKSETLLHSSYHVTSEFLKVTEVT